MAVTEVRFILMVNVAIAALLHSSILMHDQGGVNRFCANLRFANSSTSRIDNSSWSCVGLGIV